MREWRGNDAAPLFLSQRGEEFMTDLEYQQMLDELAKLSPNELETRKRFFDEWAQLDQMGRELLHQWSTKK